MSRSRQDDIKNAGLKSRNALAWLRDNQLPAEPICYTIAYEYLYTDNNQLKKQVDEIDLSADNYREKLNEVFENSILSSKNQQLSIFGDHDDQYVCEILSLLVKNYDHNEDISDAVDKIKTIIGQNKNQADEDESLDVEHPLDNYLKVRDNTSQDKLTNCLDFSGLKHTVAEASIHDELFPMSILRVNIDRFKLINDVNGTFMGDNVLKHLVKLFISTTKGSDLVSRYEDDEFIVVLPKTPLKQGLMVADNLRKKVMGISLKKKGNTNVVKLTVSIGVAQYERKLNFEDVLIKTKKSLNRSKDLGRNSINSED
ncbi:GGDEF domain-containing protein [Aliikangiella maris]|uniref:diguanylate cyclase n=2 Tax=Aliikangiella maris TaxID=3162458 RepID=A0ABV3MKA3_9GAMM